MTKDATSLGQTLSIVHDAHEHIMRFPSQAPDSGERGRTCIHLFERIVNQAQSRPGGSRDRGLLLQSWASNRIFSPPRLDFALSRLPQPFQALCLSASANSYW